MDIPESSRIVYLDQNAWIELSRVREGRKSSCDKKLLETIMQASNNGTAFFPMSLIHLSELPNPASPWRKELLSLMIEISKYYTFTPCWFILRELEIKNLILREFDIPPINVRSYFVGKGFSHLIGKNPTIKSESTDPETLKKVNQELQNALNDPEEFLFLAQKIFKDSTRGLITDVQKYEDIRERLSKIKDNRCRRKAFLWANIFSTILPQLYAFLNEMNLPLSLTEKIFGNYDADVFLSKLPTALCEFMLMFQRDQQSNRPIQVNDSYDIWHLTLAIPYSDIVVTEKMWTTIAKNTKLDKICNTLILSSIDDLRDYL